MIIGTKTIKMKTKYFLPEYNEILQHAKTLSEDEFRDYWNQIQSMANDKISTKEFLKQHKRVINSPNLMPWYEIPEEKMMELISIICDEKELLVINELKKHGYNLDYIVYQSKNPEI